MQRILVTLLLALITATAAVAADLTGTWKGDDGGTYYLRQVGNQLFWYGERSTANPAWSNVFTGRVQGDRVRGEWADVPKGRTMNEGRLDLSIERRGNELVAERKTGGFGGSRWTREGAPVAIAPIPRPGMRPRPVPMAPREDCVNFDPRNAQVSRVSGRWKIVDGSHWVFDFGGNEAEARRALRVIRHYRADQSCFVGRPDPSLSYLLAGGAAPAGPMPGEDCVGFNPGNIEVQQIGGRWKIVEGSHWIFDFQNKEAEARQALNIIRHHEFRNSCFVGRPNPSFSYLRR